VGTTFEEQVRENSIVSDSDDFQPCNKKQKLSLSKTKTKARIVLMFFGYIGFFVCII